MGNFIQVLSALVALDILAACSGNAATPAFSGPGVTSQGSLVATSPGLALRLRVASGRSLPPKSTNLYVANSNGYGDVTVYAPGTSKPLRTINAKIPTSLAFDTAGNLYVASLSDVAVDVYAAGTTKLLRKITNGVTGPVAIALDQSGNVAVANDVSGGGADVTFYKSGTTELLRTMTSGVSGPGTLAFFPTGDSFDLLYLANDTPYSTGPGSVTVYEPLKNAKLVETISNGIDFPGPIAFNSVGTLFVGNYGKHTVTSYPFGGTYLGATIKVNGPPTALAFDSSGNLYVAIRGSKSSVNVYPAGTIVMKRQITQGISYPDSLAFGPNGYLNVANTAGGSSGEGSITEYASGSGKVARTITKGVSFPVSLGFGP